MLIFLDKFQKEVLNATGGEYLVLAPPGCGKTELLTHRIIRAHNEERVEYRDMLCLTFTNRAARSMRERFASTIHEPCEELFVGNIHRFCSRFLYENQLIPFSTGIIDELDQKDILDEFGFTKYNDTCNVREDVLSVQDVTKLATLTAQKEADHPKEVWLSEPIFRSERARLTAEWMSKQYYEYKREHCLIDFDDILLLVYTEMINPGRNFKNLNYSDYHWIQVDEVQDLNALQLAIVDGLRSREDYTVVYLGDEQQAIYSFMGAKLQSLRRLAEKSGEGHVLRLYANYRSPKYLVDLLNTYAVRELKMDARLLPLAMKDEASEKGCLNIFEYRTREDSMADLVTILRRLNDQYPEERVGVLVRSNASAGEVSSTLEKAGVPHFKLSGQDVFKRDDFKVLMSHFSVVQRDTNYFDWARLLWKTCCAPSFKDARDVVSRLRKAAVSPLDLMRDEYGTSYVDAFLKVYREKEIVIFDTETTGLNVEEDDIIQIAAIKVRGGEVVPGSELDMVIRTDREIPAMLGDIENPLVTLYHQRKEAGKLCGAQALLTFLDYVGDDAVLGHNVEYDWAILKHNLFRRCNGCILEKYIVSRWDSLRLIRLLQPRLRVYKLKALLETFGLAGANSHRADDDILATKSLVDFCCKGIEAGAEARQSLWKDVNIHRVADALRENYAGLYRETARLMSRPANGTVRLHNIFMEEFRRVYNHFVEKSFIAPIPGFDYIEQFYSSSVFSSDEESSFRGLVEAHLKDMKTYTQADLCDSGVVMEKNYVMTVHKAKGLEFEHVILYDAVDGIYPRFSKTPSPQERLEDARLFYVGLSRSKKRISILYPIRYKGWPKVLTPFMRSIMERFQKYRRYYETDCSHE